MYIHHNIMCALLLVALYSSSLSSSSPAFRTSDVENPQDATSSVEIRGLGLQNIVDVIKHSLDRFINKLVDETHHNFPALRRTVDDFKEAIKEFRLHKLTHAALMKTLTGFTKGLYEVRNQLAQVEKMEGIVRWMDERVKGLCYILSVYHEDCGYPDVDTVGMW